MGLGVPGALGVELARRVRTSMPVDPEGRTLSLWVCKEGIQSKRGLKI